MIKIKSFTSSILFFVSFFLFSQESQHVGSLMNIEIKAKSRQFKSVNFDKAQTFFRESNWDSTLVYSMKEINNSKIKSL